MVLVTPVSWASTCWVRSAICAARSVGRARTSSIELVCSELVPPSPAAMASYAVRLMLFSTCWRVSDTPAVCVWKRSIQDFGSLAPYLSRIRCAHSRRAARNLAISSKKSMCESKKKERRGAEASDFQPAFVEAPTVAIPPAQGEERSSAAGGPAPRGVETELDQ